MSNYRIPAVLMLAVIVISWSEIAARRPVIRQHSRRDYYSVTNGDYISGITIPVAMPDSPPTKEEYQFRPGTCNTLVGFRAGFSLTIGSGNFAFGRETLSWVDRGECTNNYEACVWSEPVIYRDESNTNMITGILLAPANTTLDCGWLQYTNIPMESWIDHHLIYGPEQQLMAESFLIDFANKPIWDRDPEHKKVLLQLAKQLRNSAYAQ